MQVTGIISRLRLLLCARDAVLSAGLIASIKVRYTNVQDYSCALLTCSKCSCNCANFESGTLAMLLSVRDAMLLVGSSNGAHYFEFVVEFDQRVSGAKARMTRRQALANALPRDVRIW